MAQTSQNAVVSPCTSPKQTGWKWWQRGLPGHLSNTESCQICPLQNRTVNTCSFGLAPRWRREREVWGVGGGQSVWQGVTSLMWHAASAAVWMTQVCIHYAELDVYKTPFSQSRKQNKHCTRQLTAKGAELLSHIHLFSLWWQSRLIKWIFNKAQQKASQKFFYLFVAHTCQSRPMFSQHLGFRMIYINLIHVVCCLCALVILTPFYFNFTSKLCFRIRL